MEPEEESIVARTRRTIKSLPDPYGHGFARNEDPLERTREAWEKSERFRMKSGRIANNTFFLAFRNVVGFGIATTAVFSLSIHPFYLYLHRCLFLAIWLIPVLAAFTHPSQEVKQHGLQLKRKYRFVNKEGLGMGKDTPYVRNRAWTESWKVCEMEKTKQHQCIFSDNIVNTPLSIDAHHAPFCSLELVAAYFDDIWNWIEHPFYLDHILHSPSGRFNAAFDSLCSNPPPNSIGFTARATASITPRSGFTN
jgi:hypothetical protein